MKATVHVASSRPAARCASGSAGSLSAHADSDSVTTCANSSRIALALAIRAVTWSHLALTSPDLCNHDPAGVSRHQERSPDATGERSVNLAETSTVANRRSLQRDRLLGCGTCLRCAGRYWSTNIMHSLLISKGLELGDLVFPLLWWNHG